MPKKMVNIYKEDVNLIIKKVAEKVGHLVSSFMSE
jgi:hypothetical protein